MTKKNFFTCDNPIMFDWENERCRCTPIPYKEDKMTEKRFTKCDTKIRDYGEEMTQAEVRDMLNELATKCSKLEKENEQLKQQKPFLKIHDDYFIQYGDDKELFNLHKPSDIRSLFYLINRENGYGELECEYNEEGYGND